jgi:hypothetical protein
MPPGAARARAVIGRHLIGKAWRSCRHDPRRAGRALRRLLAEAGFFEVLLDASRHLPRPLRRRVEQVHLALVMGALRDPAAWADGLRHRRALRRVSRALHHHRHASALLAAHDVGALRALAGPPRTRPWPRTRRPGAPARKSACAGRTLMSG